MSDTPCVDGCGQDAATIERLRAERDRLRAIVTEAALETYTPDGSERFVAEFHQVLAERDELRAKVARVEAVLRDISDPNPEADQDWRDDPIGCVVDALRAALAPQNHPRSAVDAPEAPGRPGRGEEGSGGRTAALCIGCGWCCQSTPRERRGQAHKGCH